MKPVDYGVSSLAEWDSVGSSNNPCSARLTPSNKLLLQHAAHIKI
jgi:hypothetical protein